MTDEGPAIPSSSSNISTSVTGTKVLKRSHSPSLGTIHVASTSSSLNALGTPLSTRALRILTTPSGSSPSIHINGSGGGTSNQFSMPPNGDAGLAQDQFSVKARQEVYVLQRVSELQKEGLWSDKRLPKLQEPSRPKTHWDYVLEEMVWLAADFAQERKWKKACAKKCARMVQKYFQDQAVAAQRAERAQEAQLKRIAAFMAKEIKVFWSNAEELVEHKQQTRLKETRKKALDQRLSFIVDQTEKLSAQLTEGMNRGLAVESTAPSLNSSRISSPKHGKTNTDDEFSPGNESSSDDEETIAKEEAEIVGADEDEENKNELADLEAENELSIEELMRKYSSLSQVENMEVDSEATDDDDEESADSAQEDQKMSSDEESGEEEEANKSLEEEVNLKNLINDGGENNDQLIDDAAAIAESIQPKGNTLSSTNVVTEVPFLLKHSLREYQHIGLDWLVTMHDRKLNGILADEMGLGKTIQTISLLAHLACVKGNWGPHLIIVPSSVMLNWEMEFKKWCPGFKILTYYGAQKERKAKRVGWTKVNTFHICITSYKLVIQDHQSFRRKKWKYLILDEAQNIKNFKSQRWQLLLNFQTEQRLLLTGTPLQNNLMELWSLMHFLMPHVFQSHKEFKEWFSNPMSGMIEGISEYNDSIVKRLHKVLRPFLLRRLKCEVEKQMPKKYEHVVMCRLSKRQRYLYDDFMSRAKTRETLASGNLLSVINVLMQLRKVCNHPNLFEVRPTISPFRTDGIRYKTASLVTNLFEYDPLNDINLQALNMDLLNLELSTTAYVAYRSKTLSTPKRLIEEIDRAPELPPQCPRGRFRMHIKMRDDPRPKPSSLVVNPGTSPAMRYDGNKFYPALHQLSKEPPPLVQSSSLVETRRRSELVAGREALTTTGGMLIQAANGRHFLIPTSTTGGTTTVLTQAGHRLTVVSKSISSANKTTAHLLKQPVVKLNDMIPANMPSNVQPLAAVVAQQLRHLTASKQATNKTSAASASVSQEEAMDVTEASEFSVPETEQLKKEQRIIQLKKLCKFNEKHCDATPMYGQDLIECMRRVCLEPSSSAPRPWTERGYELCQRVMLNRQKHEGSSLVNALKSYEQRTREMKPIFDNFVTFVPSVFAPRPMLHVSHPHPSQTTLEEHREQVVREKMGQKLVLLHPIISAMSTQVSHKMSKWSSVVGGII